MGGIEERVRAGFHGQPFMSFLGAELSAVGVGSCEIRLPFQKSLTQQHGFFHGGVIATLADNAGAGAAYSQMAEGEQPLSVEFKINLLAKAVGECLVARARVIQNGRRIKVSQTDVFARKDGVEERCATALVTVIATKMAGIE